MAATPRHDPPSTRQPLLILTGAGASKWLGKATTFDIYESPEFKEAAERIYPNTQEVMGKSAKGGLALIQAVRAFLQRERPNDPIDLEFLLDFMRTTKDTFFELAKVPGYRENLVGADAPKKHEAAHDAVLDFIVEYYGDINPSLSAELYRPFLQGLARELEIASRIEKPAAPMKLFTLNYDEAIESAMDELETYELVHGFRGMNIPVWDPATFDRAVEAPPQHKKLLLYKLHGSASWTRSPKDGRIQKTALLTRGQRGREHVILYPTRGTKPIDKEPYSVAYAAFRQALHDADVGLFIGTSFRDNEITSEIRKRVQMPKAFRLIAVNPKIDAATIARETSVSDEAIELIRISFEPSSMPQIFPHIRDALAASK